MVEMRWVTRRDAYYRDGLPQGHGPAYKVLQYRYQIDKAQWGPICSEWIDVPTVVEGDK